MITINIDDNKGNIQTFNISDGDEKSLLYDISDLKNWIESAVKSKARHNKNQLVKETMGRINSLTKIDRNAIVSRIIKDGEVLKDLKDMSAGIKDEIIKRTKITRRGK